MSEFRHHNALQEGYRLHWYVVDSILGQGGFGITYLAHDTNLDQQVAIKEFLPTELAVRASDQSVQPVSTQQAETYSWGLDRFLTEARTLAKFRHPNIVRVYSVFEANNTAYMVMEYERGQSLEEAYNFRRVESEEQLLDILFPLLDGIQLIHDEGFIHRDIKPNNIFLREDGRPVLLDFGSARHALGAQTHTLTTLVSPGYAPFEQYNASRDSDKQGPWTDIYAFGATLYRGVTGKGPADALARVNALVGGQEDILRPAAEAAARTYSETFLSAIDWALRFNPEDRPQSIEEWRAVFPPWEAPNVTGRVTLSGAEEDNGLTRIRPPTARGKWAGTASAGGAKPEASAPPPDKPSKKPASKPAPEAPAPQAPAPGSPAPAPAAPHRRDDPTLLLLDDEPTERAEDAVQRPVEPASPPPARERRSMVPVAAGGALAVVAAVAVWALVSTSDENSSAPTVVAATGSAPPVKGNAEPPTAPVPAPAMPPPAAGDNGTARTDPSVAAALEARIQEQTAAYESRHRTQIAAVEPNEPVAPPMPTPPEPSLADITSTVDRTACSSLSATLDGRTVQVKGITATADELAGLREQLVALPGVEDVRVDAQVVPPGKCRVVDVLGPYLTAGGGTRVRTAKGDTEFAEGEPLVLEISTPGYPTYVYVDYFALDGSVVHMLPSPRAEANQASADLVATLGDLGEWTVAPPFGTEMIVVVTSPEPLFDDMRTEAEKNEVYLEALARRIEAVGSRVGEDRIQADYLLIRTYQ